MAHWDISKVVLCAKSRINKVTTKLITSANKGGLRDALSEKLTMEEDNKTMQSFLQQPARLAGLHSVVLK